MTDERDEHAQGSARMSRCTEMLRELRGSHLSDISRFTLAFDVIYLCALDSLPRGGEPGPHVEHPSFKYLSLGMELLGISPAQATVVGLMFGWYEYVSPSMPSSISPTQIELTVENIYAKALSRREKMNRRFK
jgi:hypothetical protein